MVYVPPEESFEITRDGQRVRVIVTRWDHRSYSVYAEYDQYFGTKVFDPLIDQIDHFPSEDEIVSYLDDAEYAFA